MNLNSKAFLLILFIIFLLSIPSIVIFLSPRPSTEVEKAPKPVVSVYTKETGWRDLANFETTIVRTGETVLFSAKKSWDPNDEIVAYRWVIETQSGLKTVEGIEVNYTYLYDGEYDVELKVVDSEGDFNWTHIKVKVLLAKYTFKEALEEGVINVSKEFLGVGYDGSYYIKLKIMRSSLHEINVTMEDMFFPATEEHPEIVCTEVKGIYSIHYIVNRDPDTGEEIIKIEYDPADIRYFIPKSQEWSPPYFIACRKKTESG
ncbi:MAG: hypothetical protein DRJ37_03235 [Thermoprotei archaeon]|nr:MAG: hypothetical protein DRJ37_03235 [Thermoprotei archaeon]